MNTQTINPKSLGIHSVRRLARTLFNSVAAPVLLLLTGGTNSHAASDAWDGSTDGVWATSANWLTDSATVPGTGA